MAQDSRQVTSMCEVSLQGPLVGSLAYSPFQESSHCSFPPSGFPGAGKDCRQESGETEDEMVGWHRRLNGHWFE